MGVEIVEYPMLRLEIFIAWRISTDWLLYARGQSNTHVLTSIDHHVIREVFLIPNWVTGIQRVTRVSQQYRDCKELANLNDLIMHSKSSLAESVTGVV